MEAQCEQVRTDEKDNEQTKKKYRGKTEKDLKTAPVSAKHAIFAT